MVEVLDDFRLLFARANSKPGVRIPDPLHVARPRERAKKPIGWSEFGQMLRGG